MVYHIYVGSYTDQISTLVFDPQAASLTLESSLTAGHHPSWLTRHPTDRSLIFTGLEQSNGQIVAVKYDKKGHGTIVGIVPGGGADPCNLTATSSDVLVGNVRLFLLTLYTVF